MNDKNTISDKIILGIDPGTNVMGYGIISIHNKQITLLAMGVVKLSKIPDHNLRLKTIYERTVQLIDSYKADEFAIEAPFFGKNVQSMLKLGRAQGVAMAAALSREVPVVEYLPTKVKKSITGRGAASKEQVAAMLQNIVPFDNIPKFLDATDGLAVAICHYFQGSKSKDKKEYSGWDAFLKSNPDRKV